MMSLVALALLLLNGVANRPQSGSSQDEIAKSFEESGFDCQRGRVMSINDTNPIANALIIVRKAKHTFPDAHVTATRLEREKVVAKLRTDEDGYINLASLKQGDYFFELSIP